MFIVIVDFTIVPQHASEFSVAMCDNAAQSLAVEAGCRQFDVCVDPTNRNEFFLYEVYDSKAAFDLHLKSEHFLRFNEIVAPWVASKLVKTLNRIQPASP